jgi:hypothetical protein
MAQAVQSPCATTTENPMKTAKNVALVLALTLGSTLGVGCSGSEVEVDECETDPASCENPNPNPQPGSTTADGRYRLQSEFDMATGLPGPVGDVVNMFIEATDDADDPAGWILDMAFAQVTDPTLRGILQGVRTVAAGLINDQILAIAPDFVGTMINVGDAFGQVARDFGTTSELNVVLAGNGYTATHTVTGSVFKIDGQSYTFPYLDYGMQNIIVTNVPITYATTGTFTIGNHEIPVSYGRVLRLALDELIIPTVDPQATSLGEMFQGLVDCDLVGQSIADQIGFGSGSTYSSLCTTGLLYAGTMIYDRLNQLDANAMRFQVTGTSRADDTNNDKKTDRITSGTWNGQVLYATTPSTLTNSTYAGTRM